MLPSLRGEHPPGTCRADRARKRIHALDVAEALAIDRLLTWCESHMSATASGRPLGRRRVVRTPADQRGAVQAQPPVYYVDDQRRHAGIEAPPDGRA
jgi:hypothetical protein